MKIKSRYNRLPNLFYAHSYLKPRHSQSGDIFLPHTPILSTFLFLQDQSSGTGTCSKSTHDTTDDLVTSSLDVSCGLGRGVGLK